MKNKLEIFLEEINFDKRIEESVKSDIDNLSKELKENKTIKGFGFYITWEDTFNPTSFWEVSFLTDEGMTELGENEVYATGSWDYFDNPQSEKSKELTMGFYPLIEEFFGKNPKYVYEFYSEAKFRIAKILFAQKAYIGEKFSVEDNLILSVAGHDEYEMAQFRMDEARDGLVISTEIEEALNSIKKQGYAFVTYNIKSKMISLDDSKREYNYKLNIYATEALAKKSIYSSTTDVRKLEMETLLTIYDIDASQFGDKCESFAWIGINVENFKCTEIRKREFIEYVQ